MGCFYGTVVKEIRLQLSKMAASMCELIDELPNSINKYDTLQKIQILVSQIHPRNLREIVANVSFDVIFEYLGEANDRSTRLADARHSYLAYVRDPKVNGNTLDAEHVESAILYCCEYYPDCISTVVKFRAETVRVPRSKLTCLRTVTWFNQEIAVCCDVLEKLFRGLEPHGLLPQFSKDLVHGLSHPIECVRLLCLHQALRVAEEIPQQFIQHEDILSEIIAKISDDSLRVAKEAAHIVMALGKDQDAACQLFQGQCINDLQQQLMDVSDTNRFRTYELITDFARLSPENLSLCTGLLQHLVNEVYKEDVLVRLNAIELLTRLASVQHGLDFMDNQGIMDRLDEMMKNVDSDPMMAFLLPGLVKFFGAVAYLVPKEVCQQHPSFLSLVFSLHENHDPSTRGLAAETVGMVGRKIEGKHLLEQQGTRMLNTCKQMGIMLRDADLTLKEKVLGAVENLLTLPVEEQTSDLLSLVESWYSRLAPQPMSLFMDLLEKPFQAIRCAVFRIMTVMAMQPWGQAQFRDHPTFCEFLLNRGTEHSKQEKEEKFRIIRTLVESPTILDIMGRVYCVKLKEFVKEGPFFVQAQSAVAMESET
ncbi:hypothetical protein LSH36_21g11000 [Paralvinella palmiformis]|uniref:26S proteasome non-ATPase regulatory subunit 5 n=1 Tax=Paralvinella palmiformis TaxID=53620 RepID=A0AAD9NGT3_9ANNE|nr:hypothetical protein LSH36_21g11000 [Paralvinella palmiformis]